MDGNTPESRAASISFRQLRLFEAVGRLQSVRRASEACNLSQPAVTQALTKLESQVGTELLLRHASGSYLTELGQIFYRRVVQFVQRTEQALHDLGVVGAEEEVLAYANRLSRSKVRGLVAIVDNPVLEQAAVTVGVSEATVQRAARSLEWDLQSQLFRRTADGLVLTPAAIQFGRALKLAMQEVEWGIAEVQAELGSFKSRILVGAMLAGGSVLLGRVLDEFASGYPGVEVCITTERSSALLNLLRAGNIDLVIGLLQDPVPDDLQAEAFARTPYAIAARRGHRLLNKGQVTLEDLRGYEWVIGSRGSSRRGCFEALFAGGPLPPAPIATSSVALVPHVLARSDRLTLLTSYEIEHEADMLVQVPFAQLQPVPELGVTLRKGWQPTKLHSDFIGLVRRKMAEFTGARPVPRLAG